MITLRRLSAVILTVALLLLSGCWSRRELTDVSFVGAIGVDWVDDQYQISINVLSPRRQGGGGKEGGGAPQENVWNFVEKAPSIDAAMAKLDQILQRSLTLSHVRSIIIGEEMARRGIGPIMDFLLRSVEIRPTAWMGVTNGMAADVINARPRQEPIPSDGPLGHHDLAQKRGSIVPAWRKTRVANILQEEGIDLSLPLFRLGNHDAPNPERAMDEGAMQGRPEYAREVIYGGAGIFVDDRLVGWLTPAAARGMLWGHHMVVHGAISAECPTPSPDQRIVFRMRRASGRVLLRAVAGKLQATIQANVVADVNENNCASPAMFDGDMSLLQKQLADRIRQNIQEAVAVAHETGSDFFGFGQNLFRYQPAEYMARQSQWHQIMKSLPIQVDVRAQVVRTGELYKRFQWTEVKGKP